MSVSSAGYFRRAQALAGQEKFVDAAATYLQCLLLDESREVKTHLAKVRLKMNENLIENIFR